MLNGRIMRWYVYHFSLTNINIELWIKDFLKWWFKMNKDELAKEIAKYWKENCTDTNVMSNEFYKNCIQTITEELEVGAGPIPDEVYEIWQIIEEKYMSD